MDLTRQLLDLGADPNVIADWDSPVAIVAVVHKASLEVLMLLAARGADLRRSNADGCGALQALAEVNATEPLTWLDEQGGPVLPTRCEVRVYFRTQTHAHSQLPFASHRHSGVTSLQNGSKGGLTGRTPHRDSSGRRRSQLKYRKAGTTRTDAMLTNIPWRRSHWSKRGRSAINRSMSPPPSIRSPKGQINRPPGTSR